MNLIFRKLFKFDIFHCKKMNKYPVIIEDKLSKIIYTRSSYKDDIFYVEILSDEMRRSKRNDNMKLHGSRLPKNQSDLQNKKNTSIWFP